MNSEIQISNPASIRAYFEKIREMAKSGNKYPVTLNDVWPLVYSKKQKAVDVLKKEYNESEDFEVFTQNGKNPSGGRPELEYKLTVSCMEHLVARKVRAIFNVYREVFHAVADQLEQQSLPQKEQAPAPYFLPQNHIEALQAYLDQLKVTESQKLQIEADKPKIEHYNRCSNADGYFDMAKVAQMIGTGQNRLFDFLRQQRVLFYDRGHNRPYQQYVDLNWFVVRQKTFNKAGKEESYPQVYVTPHGVESIRKRWDNRGGGAQVVYSTTQPSLF